MSKSHLNFNRKFIFQLFFIFLSFAMVTIIIFTSLKSNLFTLKITEPWFYTTLIDFYFNIVIISSWAIYKEKKLICALLWILSFILLGSVTTCFYVFLKVSKLKEGDSFSKVFLKDE